MSFKIVLFLLIASYRYSPLQVCFFPPLCFNHKLSLCIFCVHYQIEVALAIFNAFFFNLKLQLFNTIL